jgi:hypothetical protein
VNYYDVSFYEYTITYKNQDGLESCPDKNQDSLKLCPDKNQDSLKLCPDKNQDSLNKRHHINGNYGRYSRMRSVKINDNCCNFV